MKSCRFVLLLAVVLPTSATHARVALAQACPESCISVGSPQCSLEPIRSASTSGGHGYGPGDGSYNLPAGTSQASASPGLYGGAATVSARDDFRVVGVPVGTPLAFAAEWNYSLIGSFEATFEVRIGQGDEAWMGGWTGAFGQPFFSETGRFVYALTTNAGDTFRLTTLVAAGTGRSGGATTNAFLRFTGLPQGARVESCQGYQQDFPVPALQASWGSLKNRYR